VATGGAADESNQGEDGGDVYALLASKQLHAAAEERYRTELKKNSVHSSLLFFFFATSCLRRTDVCITVYPRYNDGPGWTNSRCYNELYLYEVLLLVGWEGLVADHGVVTKCRCDERRYAMGRL
jgi:hypothetical protein